MVLQVSTLHLVIFCSALDAMKFSSKCMEGTIAVKSGVCIPKDPSLGNVCLNIPKNKYDNTVKSF